MIKEVEKEVTELEPVTKIRQFYVYDIGQEITICPKYIQERLNEYGDNLILEDGWELTQKMVEKLSEQITSDWEGDYYEVSEEIDRMFNDYNDELTDTNQRILWSEEVSGLLLSSVVGDDGKQYHTPKFNKDGVYKYNGYNELIYKHFSEKYRNLFDEWSGKHQDELCND